VIKGRGASSLEKRHYINGKYIDLEKLGANILSIKYGHNDTPLPSVKSQSINNDVKEVVEDLIRDKYDKRLFDKLQPSDKRIIQKIVKVLKLDLPVASKEDEDFIRDFEILKGELLNGNDNPTVRKQMKKYIVEAMNNNLIPLRECHLLLFQLALE
jgi:hypothetical protein